MKRLSLLSAVLASSLAVTGCTALTGSAGTDQTTFRFSVNTWVGYAPFFLAQEKGFFAEEGIDAEIVVIEDVAQRKNALTSGRLDGAADTVDALPLYIDQGVPGTMVAQLDVSDGADGIVAVDGITSIADLKGKKIAVQRNFVSEAFLNYALIDAGLSPSDVTPVDMEGGAAGAAFVAGSVDAAVTFEPWLTNASEREGGHLLASSRDYPGAIVDVLFIHPEYLQSNPEAVRGVLRAWFRAVEFAKTNPDEAYAIMAPHYNVSPEEFAGFLDGVKWPSQEENVAYFSSGKALEVANTFADLFLITKQLTQKADLAPGIDASPLNSL